MHGEHLQTPPPWLLLCAPPPATTAGATGTCTPGAASACSGACAGAGAWACPCSGSGAARAAAGARPTYPRGPVVQLCRRGVCRRAGMPNRRGGAAGGDLPLLGTSVRSVRKCRSTVLGRIQLYRGCVHCAGVWGSVLRVGADGCVWACITGAGWTGGCGRGRVSPPRGGDARGEAGVEGGEW